jgi:hypothetical protein
MQTTFATDSERIFHDHCIRHGFLVEKVETSKEKTPDFLLQKESLKLFAEVKELTPNEDDRKYDEDKKKDGFAVFSCTIGQRVRGEIVKSAKQLKKFASDCPGIVVIYENLGEDGFPRYTNPVFVNVAMYGNWMISSVRVPEAIRKPDFCGGNGTTTRDHKRYLSAVCVMTDKQLLFYHNSFADRPLPREVFSGEDCLHFRKISDPHDAPGEWDNF